jgi:ferredoxin
MIEFRMGRECHRSPYTCGDTILETARRAQLTIPFGCEQGVCGACVVTILQGSVRMRNNSVLSLLEIEEGLALACQSLPDSTELVVEVA